MMKIVKVKEWKYVERKSETGKEPQFSVIISDHNISSENVTIHKPDTGVVETGMDINMYDLFAIVSPIRSNAPGVAVDQIFFRKKTVADGGGEIKESQFPNQPAASILGDPVGKIRKMIMDDESGTAVTVSKTAAAIGKPGKEMIIGDNGPTMQTSPTVLDVPSEKHGIVNESGLLRFLPKCFLPPFCFPDYLPNLKLVAQIAGVVAVAKTIKALIDEGP